ncbi:peptide chain release factor N(5)-glutamine methyltransferase [Salipaludibacillus aurantiacus]|uniref:Release factor glutamine methyltransferase n=1 Tax=Salipaludibacillus aurantiacus TaxID=1601833 RepID=A0A1H9VCE0_9BACI|nr:peptide chain release factor N(5)-glutamine methyltransferase [Salipaludibacillus aurantiacus]SES19352.1 release factor glutamine methyltransferase [Salipaludibacillus aurantiacus]
MNANEGKKVYEALNWASSFLQSHDYEEEIARRLLMHHTGWSRTRMLTELRTVIETEVLNRFEADVREAATGTPVQHLTGEEVFYGRSFKVGPDVLIPRPETEELVERVLGMLNSRKDIFWKNREETPAIIDVGTGSGIIAATMALELGTAHVLASDISSRALTVAKKNAARLGARVDFLEGDLLTPFIESGIKAEVILSNPPYIPERDRSSMKENVTGHEPENALFAGEDGLDIYRRLLKQVPAVLKTPGIVAFEIGHDQGEAVSNLLKKELPQTATIQVIRDINQNERIVLAEVW